MEGDKFQVIDFITKIKIVNNFLDKKIYLPQKTMHTFIRKAAAGKNTLVAKKEKT